MSHDPAPTDPSSVDPTDADAAALAESACLESLLAQARVDVPRAESYAVAPDQVYERYGPRGGALVVFVHGGYFRPGIDRSNARPAARALARAGFDVVLAEYRRIPGDPDAALDDLRLLAAHLERVAGSSPVLWVGHSAGGALVLTLGLAWAAEAGRAPLGVLALAPIADLTAGAHAALGDGAVTMWMGGGPGEIGERYDRLDPVRLAARARGGAADADAQGVADSDARAARTTLVHGRRDVTVPPEHGADFPARHVDLDAHHFDLVDPASPAWAEVVAVARAQADSIAAMRSSA